MTPRLQPNEFSVTGEPGLYINYAKFMDELLGDAANLLI